MQVLHQPLRVACDMGRHTLDHIHNGICGCTSTFVAHTPPMWDMHALVDLTVSSNPLVPWTRDMAAISRFVGCDCVVGARWGVVVVVVAGCAVMAGVRHRKLAMNSVGEPTGGVVSVCASGYPSNVDGPLPLRDCICRTKLVVSPSCHCGPLSVISDAWCC
ncbi:unnamed protein product [Lactuca saligna]|uniref:Uncharacterized protein n=1 Tax=Lactuca saligna TaxID=75948 RepID=A0AA35YEF6_LACSI|nr:unnamed protein product [Lactuca saligna]